MLGNQAFAEKCGIPVASRACAIERVAQPVQKVHSERALTSELRVAAWQCFFEAAVMRLHVVLVMAVVCSGGAAAAHGSSLQVEGTLGYLSEWEISGTISQRSPGSGDEFFGRLIWKHVGLCSVSGPQEKSGEIRVQISKQRAATAHIHAVLSLEGTQCTYSGEFSGSSTGYMDCSDAKGVPLSISLR